jgi:hypothetical protein
MRHTKNLFYTILISVFIFFGCSKNEDQISEIVSKEKRTFYMGTTPWPADLTVAEVNKTYDFVNNHCDIVAHHFDEGIPFEEAFTNAIMPNSLVDNVNFRLQKTAINKKIFLSVSALAINRTSKASYYNNATTAASIKTYWENLPFDDPKVITAYVNYVNWLINKFHPIYVNYGVESNGMLWNPTEFVKYKNFLSQVYQRLKVDNPNIPIFISFIVDESPQGFNYANQLITYTDFIGLSAYPYIGVSSSANGDTNPANIPANYFEKYTNLSATKPLAFTETGYTAENLVIPGLNLNKQGNENYQKDYLEKVINICKNKKAKLFIWFCPKDYNALITNFQNQGIYTQQTIDLLSLWKDIGLINENGVLRPAYNSWINYMNLEKE